MAKPSDVILYFLRQGYQPSVSIVIDESLPACSCFIILCFFSLSHIIQSVYTNSVFNLFHFLACSFRARTHSVRHAPFDRLMDSLVKANMSPDPSVRSPEPNPTLSKHILTEHSITKANTIQDCFINLLLIFVLSHSTI
jgi:hypothetical protein